MTRLNLYLIFLSICTLFFNVDGFLRAIHAPKSTQLPSILSPSLSTGTNRKINECRISTDAATRLQAQTFKGFDDMLAKIEEPVLVDFYAEWCGPCKMMQPVLEDVAGRMEGIARVAKVDTEKSPKLAARYQIEALPTLIVFYKGEAVERLMGYRSADELEKEFRSICERVGAAPKAM